MKNSKYNRNRLNGHSNVIFHWNDYSLKEEPLVSLSLLKFCNGVFAWDIAICACLYLALFEFYDDKMAFLLEYFCLYRTPILMKSKAGQWWQVPLIPALGRQRQADFWVWGQPGLQSSRTARAIQRNPVSKNKNNNNNNNKKYKDRNDVPEKARR